MENVFRMKKSRVKKIYKLLDELQTKQDEVLRARIDRLFFKDDDNSKEGKPIMMKNNIEKIMEKYQDITMMTLSKNKIRKLEGNYNFIYLGLGKPIFSAQIEVRKGGMFIDTFGIPFFLLRIDVVDDNETIRMINKKYDQFIEKLYRR